MDQILAFPMPDKRPKVLDDLPDEILLIIFHKLPIEAVGLCMCVKKPWVTLIRSPSFVFSFKQPDDDRFFIFFRNAQKLLLHRDNKAFEYHKNVTLPVRPNDFWYPVEISVCNGLVCFTKDNSTTFLWNPTIGKMLALHQPIFHPEDSKYDDSPILGFGFDSRSSDYKVIKIFNTLDIDQDPHVEVFSLDKNSWTTVSAPRYLFRRFLLSNTMVVGAFHWLASKPTSDYSVILGFDLYNQTFRDIHLPSSLAKKRSFRLDLAVYKESFLAVCDVDFIYDQFIDMWVMTEYGNLESWTHVWKCDVSAFESTHGIQREVDLLGFRKDGEVLLYAEYDKFHHGIMSVNPDTEEENQLAFNRNESMLSYKGFQYFEKSLMLLENTNAVRCPFIETIDAGTDPYNYFHISESDDSSAGISNANRDSNSDNDEVSE